MGAKTSTEIRLCSVEGCERQFFCKGWCRTHYNRNYVYGDPLLGPAPRKPPANCAVIGCDRNESLRRGYCSIHYERLRKTGDPGLPVGVYDIEKAKAKFWSKVDKSAGDSECWPWIGRIREKGKGKSTQQGYGEFTIRGKTRSSHRVAYELAFDVTLTSAQPVHHKCGNSICQNPEHLQITTAIENTAEMLERRYYQKKIEELEAELKKYQSMCMCEI